MDVALGDTMEVLLGWWLDWMTLKVFSKLSNPDCDPMDSEDGHSVSSCFASVHPPFQ